MIIFKINLILIESNAWLVPTTIGLCLDICGVVILAGPLLRFNFKIHHDLKNRVKNLEEQFTGAVKERDENLKEDQQKMVLSKYYVLQELSRLDKNMFSISLIYDKEKLNHFTTAIIALIIITTGFLLQIVGNVFR